jgi:anti-sigma-K factor RskA
MDLLRHPDLLDQLAAAHALGTLRGGARRRFEMLARENPAIRARALLWRERFAAMTELQRADQPSPNVWKRIENTVAAERPRAVPSRASSPVGPWWRRAALGGAFATLAAVAFSLWLLGEMRDRVGQLAQSEQARVAMAAQNAQLTARLEAQPDLRYVAVLADDRSAASMLVTFDPRHNTLTIKRVGGFQEASDKSLQLWALPAAGGPRSLGVLGGGGVVRLATAQQQIGDAPALAISLEPLGGVPGEGGPTGPVLFKGALLQTP